MIGYLTGKIISKKPTEILLDVNGVGYQINISTNTFEALPAEGNLSLYTFLSVKEDSLTLYGFSTLAEKKMFKLLISISGIGPKLAQSILSGIQIEELKTAIMEGNVARIIAVPGIGRKTAERLLVELRDKVDAAIEIEGEAPGSSTRNDAIAALTSLGYNKSQADKVIRSILNTDPGIEIEDLVRRALAALNS